MSASGHDDSGGATGAEDGAHDGHDDATGETAAEDGGTAPTEPATGIVDEHIREITDARTMRALAHPVRLALLEALRLHSPLTATRAAELLGESPGNMSWHLQTLAKYGFVTEAGGGRGRARPWKLVNQGMRFSSDGTSDPEQERAAGSLRELFHERQFQRHREWEAQRHAYPPEWQQAAFSVAMTTYLTAEELAQVGEEFAALLLRYTDRTADPSRRPPGAQPAQMVSFGHPLPPIPPEDPGR
jgi:DNA-binding transcriptional ArsR family regulator